MRLKKSNLVAAGKDMLSPAVTTLAISLFAIIRVAMCLVCSYGKEKSESWQILSFFGIQARLIGVADSFYRTVVFKPMTRQAGKSQNSLQPELDGFFWKFRKSFSFIVNT